MIGAEEAKSLGLVNHVFPLASLLDEAKKMATKMNSKAPLAIAKSIALVNQAANGNEEGFNNEIKEFGACFETEDMKEGVAAFMEKRKANFKGN
jgi:enoyl-CoA hydratase